MDVQNRIAELRTRIKLLDGPPGWEEEYIIYEEEVPWWRIKGLGESAKAQRRQWQRMFCRLHPDAQAELIRRHREKYPERSAETMRRYDRRHPGALAVITRRYLRTPKGKAAQAKGTAIRRSRSTNPELYAARVKQLHAMQEPCAKCHALYDPTHQIDHVVALFLGGADDWDNYQPLCVLCHRRKTGEDYHKSWAIVKATEVTIFHPEDINTIDPEIMSILEEAWKE